MNSSKIGCLSEVMEYDIEFVEINELETFLNGSKEWKDSSVTHEVLNFSKISSLVFTANSQGNNKKNSF